MAGQRRAIAPLLDPAGAVETLRPEEAADLFGLPVAEVRDAGYTVLCVIPDFRRQAARLTARADPDGAGVADLVSNADGASAKLFTSPKTVAAARAGVLDGTALQQWGRHELDELRNARRPAEERVHGFVRCIRSGGTCAPGNVAAPHPEREPAGCAVV